MKAVANILMIEDSVDDAELLSFKLEQGKIDHKITRVWEKDKLEIELLKPDWDLVLCDYYLPGFTGIDAINIIRKIRPDLPIILISGMVGEEKAVEAMKVGARDYILKDNMNRLIPSVKREMHEYKQRQIHLNTEKELEKQTSLSQLFLDHIPARTLLLDKNTHKVIATNRYGRDNGVIQGEYCYECQYQLTRPCNDCRINELSEKNKYMSFETLKDGIFNEEHWVYVSENSVLKYSFDISERKKSEIKEEAIKKELIIAKELAEESDRLKSAFLSNMSHEIRTPMNAIIGFTQILRHNDMSDKDRISYFDIIEKSGNGMVNLLSDILDFSVIESENLIISNEEFQLDEYFDELTDRYKRELSLENENNIELLISKQETNHTIILKKDKLRLTQVINNLFQNSIKFTEKGSIEIGYQVNDKEIRFHVKDSGIGIRKENQEMIFERFRQVEEEKTRTYGGTGLGLAISKSIIEIMNGKIWLESEHGKGSTFYFTLPVFRIKEDKRQKDQSLISDDEGLKTLSVLNGKTILVAEDETTNYMLIERYLKEYQLEILWAKCGETAIDFAKDRDDLDLILMDIRMPGVDGIQATKSIRRFNSEIPIIAQTAYAFQEDIDRVMESGCNDLITKPISRTLLITKMEDYIKQSSVSTGSSLEKGKINYLNM